ncbi:MAG: hypothetical protein NTV02_01775 [Candidatus Zambryskibacteria bacterium]|nr:hypothetical protein [Candidatus Zambryskibacteria bacterium]
MEQPEQKNNLSIPLVAFNISLVALVLSLGLLIYKIDTKKQDTIATVDFKKESVFVEPRVEAKSYVIWDINEKKVIAEKNADTIRPLASVTKVMSAFVAREMLPKESEIVIRKEFLQEDGDSGLRDGEVFKLSDLLDLSLIVSSNDGARAIASVAGAFRQGNRDYTLGRAEFIKQMNFKARELELATLSFTNETGLDNTNGTTGGIGSALDTAKLFGIVLSEYPDLLEATHKETEEVYSAQYVHTAINTNTSLGDIPNIIGSKTGLTAMAGGNLVVVFDAGFGKPIAIVVLGSTTEGRFTDVVSLASSTLQYINQ